MKNTKTFISVKLLTAISNVYKIQRKTRHFPNVSHFSRKTNSKIFISIPKKIIFFSPGKHDIIVINMEMHKSYGN